MQRPRPEGLPGEDRTADEWLKAVLRSIGMMRENIGEEHSLRALARAAWLSPFHFHRVFRKVTNSTPGRFLAAWRMVEAKRMLAYDSASVTDICMRIGYSSLGTFTSQFTRMVGVSPGRFRRLVTVVSDHPFNELLRVIAAGGQEPQQPQLTVAVSGGPGAGEPAAVGLFSSGIPQQRPVACGVVRLPGAVTFGDVPDGVYHALAMSFPATMTAAEVLVAADLERSYVGIGDRPVRVSSGRATPGRVQVPLRQRRPTDPPLVLALPLLAATQAERFAA